MYVRSVLMIVWQIQEKTFLAHEIGISYVFTHVR